MPTDSRPTGPSAPPPTPSADHTARLAALRQELKRQGLDGFVIPLTDEHMSEYVGAYAQRLGWLTGFEGSAGTAAVLADKAAIFVDGRYTLQVRAQVSGDDWSFEQVPQANVAAWLVAHAPPSARIGYDPALHSQPWVDAATAALADSGGVLIAVTENPVDHVWHDQPARPSARMRVHGEALAGRSATDKRTAIAEVLNRKGLDATVMTALDSIAWTFNLRGGDVAHTPVGLAYALVHADGTADLFVAPAKLDPDTQAHLGNSVRVHDYADFLPALAQLSGRRIAVDSEQASAAVIAALRAGDARLIWMRDPAVLLKAIKNKAEQAGHRAAQLRDGAAMCRFLHWLAIAGPGGAVTELDAAERLLHFRTQTGVLLDLSFDTISAAGPHAAIPHYRVTPESNLTIAPDSVFLIDSGGQYADGTTDITRTLWIGPGAPPRQVRDRFTRVLKGHIAVATAIFPQGTCGAQLDSFARQFLWAAGLDYAHGTGHGVSAYLSVHEGPQRIAKPTGAQGGTIEPLRAGMILSNEPGYYCAGAYGIRIENLILVAPRSVADEEQPMLGFETLTFAPIDRALILPALLTREERTWVDAYHHDVMARILPELNAADDAPVRAWLEAQCSPLVEG